MTAWTKEMVETIKKLWTADGYSASMIGAEIGKTRNSVIAKLDRLGLTGGEQRRTPLRRKPRSINAGNIRSSIAARERALKLVEKPISLPFTPARVALPDLEHRHCRFPLGDPRAADFAFCGANRLDDSSYCGFHHGVAYETVQQRRKKS